MNLKKIKIIGAIGIFLLCFLTHYIYEWFQNDLFAIFFPVNESIWEHMKMLFTSILLYSIIEYLLLHYYKMEYNNFLWAVFIMAFMSIIIFLTLYMPIHYIIGYSFIASLIILFITTCIVQLIGYYVLKYYKNNIKMIPIILISICYIIFGYLTYYPPKTELFYDQKNEKYGINNYNI